MKPDSLNELNPESCVQLSGFTSEETGFFIFTLFFVSFVNRDERLYTIHHSRHERPYHGLRFCVLFEQIGVAVFRYALRGGGAVDKIDVSAICKFQDAVCVFRVKFPDFVHHAVEFEFAELARCLRLENVDEHDIHHRFHEYVCAFGANVRNFVNPAGTKASYVLRTFLLKASFLAKELV